MVAKHPCPNCGTDRSAASESCPKCHFPDHNRVESIPEQAETARPQPFQFRILGVIALTVVVAIVARVVGTYGWDGLSLVLKLGAILTPVLEFLWQLWRNLNSRKVEKAEW